MNPSDPFTDAEADDAQRAFEEELEAAAAGEVTVLLEGEHGSGKSRAARRIHRSSPRAEGPLVEVDLGGLTPSLVEAQLFGHEEGAFTGADRSREGFFRRAEGGTLILEGVEGLPPAMQGKLLRVLQERVVEPLGAERPVPVDVRLVATSAVDLAGEVAEGRLREDLYYRLAVVRLHVPPLRAHLGDLPDLVRELGARVAERSGVAERPLTPAALERLAAHPWPGNVRELENALERVMILAGEGGPVAPWEFDFLGRSIEGAAQRLAREARAHGIGLDALDRAMLEGALEEERGNLSAAARRLGLSRRAFEYRLGKRRGDKR